MNKRHYYLLIVLSIAAWFSLLITLFLLLRNTSVNTLEIASVTVSLILMTVVLLWSMKHLIRLTEKRVEHKEFVESIRQTLQAPLTTINVASASQMGHLAGSNLEEVRKLASYVYAQSARLQHIVDHLNKNSSEALASDVAPRDITLSIFFDHCLQDMKIKYAHRPVDINISIVPEDLHIMADPFYLKTAVLNILDNAFQYNEHDDELHVELRVFNVGQEVHIRISDNGIGLDHSELSNIGVKYYRPSQHSHINGLGLGLFQAQKIVKAHKGRIKFQGDTTAGFTVEIVIPSE